MIIDLISTVLGFNFLVLSFVLLFRKSKYKSRNVYLGIMFLIAGVYEFLVTYFHYFAVNDIRFLRYYIPFDSLILMFIGPMFLFFTLSIIKGKVIFNLKTTIHLLFALPALSLIVYVFSLTGNERIIYYSNSFNEVSMEMNILNSIFYAHFIFYLFLSLIKLNRFRNHLKIENKIQQNLSLSWFQNYIILILSLLIITFPICVIFHSELVNLVVAQGIMNTLFFYFFFKILWSSALFPSELPNARDVKDANEKYVGSSLSLAQIEDIYDKIIQHLKKDKLFQEKEMTIVKVADQINISKHYLSQAINIKTNSNFSSLINQLRIEEAKKLLLSDEFNKYTIETIAFEVGFGNKVSFNKIFKNYEGITPSEFRKKI